MKGGAWLVLAVSALMGLGLTIGAIASRRQMSTAVVVVLCLVGIGIVLVGVVMVCDGGFAVRGCVRQGGRSGRNDRGERGDIR